MTIGERIKIMRKEKGMTQIEFARKLGKSQTHISKIENGEDYPGDNLLRDISVLCGIDFEALKEGKGFFVPPSVAAKVDDTLKVSAKFKTGLPCMEDGSSPLFFVFAPGIDQTSGIDLTTQGGFVFASFDFKQLKWTCLDKNGNVEYDISEYVCAWVPFKIVLDMLPAEALKKNYFYIQLKKQNKKSDAVSEVKDQCHTR